MVCSWQVENAGGRCARVRSGCGVARAALVLTLLGGAQTAAAQSAPSSAAAEHHNQGRAAMARGERELAYAELTQAWDLEPSGDTAGLLGQVERRLCVLRSPTTYCDLYPDAARHLSFALRHLPPTYEADTPAKLKSWLTDVKTQVGTLQIQAPSGAEVWVDGKSLGTAPLTEDVFVAPGTHTVEARSNGVQLTRQHVDIAKGGLQSIVLSDRPTARAKPARVPAVSSRASADSVAQPSLIPAYVLTIRELGVPGLGAMLGFIAILGLGWVYAYREGLLEWK